MPRLAWCLSQGFCCSSICKKALFWITEMTSKSAEGNSLFTNAVLLILTCIVNNRHQDLSHGFRFGRQSSPRLCAEACKSWGSLPLLSWRPMRVICKHVQMKDVDCSSSVQALMHFFCCFSSAASFHLRCTHSASLTHAGLKRHAMSMVLISQSWTLHHIQTSK